MEELVLILSVIVAFLEILQVISDFVETVLDIPLLVPTIISGNDGTIFSFFEFNDVFYDSKMSNIYERWRALIES